MDTLPQTISFQEAHSIHRFIKSSIYDLYTILNDLLAQLEQTEDILVDGISPFKWECRNGSLEFIVYIYSSEIEDQYYILIRDEYNNSTEDWLKYNRCRRYLLNHFIINNILFNNNTNNKVTLLIEPIVHNNNGPMGRPLLRRQYGPRN